MKTGWRGLRGVWLPGVVGSAVVAALSGAGCAPRVTELRIVDYREAADGPAQYHESFDRNYYRTDAEGNVDVVLCRRRTSSVPNEDDIMQVVYIHTFWKPIPGTTVAARDQINATVRYFIFSGRRGASFQGAGAVFFKPDRSGSELSGALEQAHLSPVSRIEAPEALFERAEISGTFRAQRDPRRVVRILNDVEQRFGSQAG